MPKMSDIFISLLLVQLFYSFGITLITYSCVKMGMGLTYVYNFTAQTLEIVNVSSKLEESMQLQTNIPIVDLAGIVYYSGNILLDLMVNFFTAVPSIITIFTKALFLLFNVDPYLSTTLNLFIFSLITILYVLYLIMFISSFRSRGGSIV